MIWPPALLRILEYYYKLQRSEKDTLSDARCKRLAKELISAYDGLERTERTDVLVPAEGAYMKPRAIKKKNLLDGSATFEIKYRWPPNDGFSGSVTPTDLEQDEQYDRLGNEDGRFLAPLVGDDPQPLSARAIPYYIPEADIRDNPAYHLYTVKKPYRDRREAVLRGGIAQAFQKSPPDGGGTQICLPKLHSVRTFKDMGVFSDEDSDGEK